MAGGGTDIKKFPNLTLALRVADELYYTMPLSHPFDWRKAKPSPPTLPQPLQSQGLWRGNERTKQTACQVNACQVCLEYKNPEVKKNFQGKSLKSAHEMNLPWDHTSWTLKEGC